MSDFHKLICGNVMLPNLADVCLVPDIFLDQDATAAIDGHVVEHVAGLGAVEHGLDGAAEFGVGDIGEPQAVEPASANLGANPVLDLVVPVCSDEVEVTGIVRFPGTIFQAKEPGATLAVAERFQLPGGQCRHMPFVLESEGSTERGGAVLVGCPRYIGGQSVDLNDLEIIILALAGKSGTLNNVAGGLFFADPHVDLSGGGVIHSHEDCLALRKGIDEVVLPRGESVVQKFVSSVGLVAGAVRVIGGDEGKLPAEIDAWFRPLWSVLRTAWFFAALEE